MPEGTEGCWGPGEWLASTGQCIGGHCHSQQINCSWEALHDSRPSCANENMTTMMRHPKWRWSCLRWTCVGAVSWQGREHWLHISERGREGQRMWRLQPKAGGEGGSQPPETRKFPVHSFPPEAVPEAASSHGMDLSILVHHSWCPCATGLLVFGWQLPFSSV